jgi:hypothetical protein
MDNIQPKYQTANSLRYAVRSTGYSEILQRITETCIKNVVPSCSQRRDLENRRQVKTIRWQSKPFGSVSHHILLKTRRSACSPAATPGPHTCAFVRYSTVPLALRQVVMNTHSGQLPEFQQLNGGVYFLTSLLSANVRRHTKDYTLTRPCLSVCPRLNNSNTAHLGIGKFWNNL